MTTPHRATRCTAHELTERVLRQAIETHRRAGAMPTDDQGRQHWLDALHVAHYGAGLVVVLRVLTQENQGLADMVARELDRMFESGAIHGWAADMAEEMGMLDAAGRLVPADQIGGAA